MSGCQLVPTPTSIKNAQMTLEDGERGLPGMIPYVPWAMPSEWASAIWRIVHGIDHVPVAHDQDRAADAERQQEIIEDRDNLGRNLFLERGK